MGNHLPRFARPEGGFSRTLNVGLDLPSWFIDDIKAIDSNLHFVYHPIRVTYDDIMNQYSGSQSDPRFCIHEFAGQQIWGWPLTDGDGTPIPDEKWHIWCLSWPYGWSHVTNIAGQDIEHLVKICDRLYLEKFLRNKYGPRAFNIHLRKLEAELREKKADAKSNDLSDFQNENKWLLKRAIENMERGDINPTNPTKEIISSYAGQGNRSKIVRPITDKEGGVYEG